MRAKFVVGITAVSPSAYPTDEAFVERLLTLGLGQTVGRPTPFADRRMFFVAEAEREWDHLPEVAKAEREQVIFFSRLPDHCRLIVTRPLEGFATFRLIHDDLAVLEKNVERISKELGKRVGALDGLEIESGRVEIFERGRGHVILIGRVMDRAFQESMRQSPAELVSAVVTGVTSVASLVVLAFADFAQGTLARGSVERFSTAMIAAFFIAVVSMGQRWWRVSRLHGIQWRASKPP